MALVVTSSSTFCQRASFSPLPTLEAVLCLFVAFLAGEHLAHATIKSYLSAVCHTHIMQGFADPFVNAQPQLQLYIALRGIKRQQGPPKRRRLPITPDILRAVRAYWNPRAGEFNIAMLWAACCLGFFGFLRAGEFTVPSLVSFDCSTHLAVGDLAVDSHSAPSYLRLRLKQSKTDPFRQGVDIIIGRTSTELCPVAAVLAYLASRGSFPGPLFVFDRDGLPLSRVRLVTELRSALQACGFNGPQYAGHSFRIGAATTAASRGLEDSTIQTLGRWRSEAYKRVNSPVTRHIR